MPQEEIESFNKNLTANQLDSLTCCQNDEMASFLPILWKGSPLGAMKIENPEALLI